MLAGGAFAAFLVHGQRADRLRRRRHRPGPALWRPQPRLGLDLPRTHSFRLACVVAVAVPYAASWLSPSVTIADTVGLAFAIAASTLCPLLVLGVWWRGLSVKGAVAGLLVGGSPRCRGGEPDLLRLVRRSRRLAGHVAGPAGSLDDPCRVRHGDLGVPRHALVDPPPRGPDDGAAACARGAAHPDRPSPLSSRIRTAEPAARHTARRGARTAWRTDPAHLAKRLPIGRLATVQARRRGRKV